MREKGNEKTLGKVEGKKGNWFDNEGKKRRGKKPSNDRCCETISKQLAPLTYPQPAAATTAITATTMIIITAMTGIMKPFHNNLHHWLLLLLMLRQCNSSNKN